MAGVALASTEVVAAAAELGFSLRPGFRFHQTDQEFVGCFLRSNVLGHGGLHIDFIPEVNVYRFEPHELPDKSFSPSTGDTGAKVEWYFFAPRGRKYPNGLRMERATLRGFWKSTGKDRPVMHNGTAIGMKKTLVYHTGRAPSGIRTDWVMHEYRLHDHHNHHIQDTYALCRVFNKNTVTPLTDVSGGADAHEDPIHFVPRGVDMNKDLMEYVFDGADSGKDPKQFVLGGVETDKYPMDYMSCSTNLDKDLKQFMLGSIESEYDPMQSVLRGIGMDNDPIHVESESNGPDANNDLMQFVLGGVGTDKDPIQVESKSDYAVADNGGMQFLTGGGDTGKGGMQFLTGGGDKDKGGAQFVTGGNVTEKGGTKYVADGTYMDRGGMQPVTVDTEKDEIKSGPTGANAGKDKSWMEFLRGDVYWNQFIPDDGLNSSAAS